MMFVSHCLFSIIISRSIHVAADGINTHTHTHTHTYMCIHTCAYTHTHTHTHMQRNPGALEATAKQKKRCLKEKKLGKTILAKIIFSCNFESSRREVTNHHKGGGLKS